MTHEVEDQLAGRTLDRTKREHHNLVYSREVSREILTEELDPNLYAPDGDPWCRYGKGFDCLNGDDCVNPNHGRRKRLGGGDGTRPDTRGT